MDEANGLGTGKYKQVFGNKNPMNIFIEHLRAVTTVCQEMGLQPMIWSDSKPLIPYLFGWFAVIFSLSNNDSSVNGYYMDPTSLPELLANVDLVFWDYFHVRLFPQQEWTSFHLIRWQKDLILLKSISIGSWDTSLGLLAGSGKSSVLFLPLFTIKGPGIAFIPVSHLHMLRRTLVCLRARKMVSRTLSQRFGEPLLWLTHLNC